MLLLVEVLLVLLIFLVSWFICLVCMCLVFLNIRCLNRCVKFECLVGLFFEFMWY